MSATWSSVQRRRAPHVVRGQAAQPASSGEAGDRFSGPQVPGENPAHWIAERAPPCCS